MPNISMCSNEKYERKKDCHRYTANPSIYQGYGEFKEDGCEYFMANYNYLKRDKYAKNNPSKSGK